MVYAVKNMRSGQTGLFLNRFKQSTGQDRLLDGETAPVQDKIKYFVLEQH